MASDASIYSLLRPATPLPDPLEQYGKVQNLQALMGQNRLQALQTQKLGTDIQEEQDFKGGLATLDPTKPEDMARLRALSPTRAFAMETQLLDRRQKQSAIDKDAAQLPGIQQDTINKAIAAHRDQLAGVETPEAAAAWLQAGYQDPILGPVMNKLSPLQDSLARIPTDPAAFQQWKQQSALGATKFIEMNKPNISTQNLGGTSQIVATPGMGGAPTVLSTTPRTVSPDAVLTDTRSRESQAEAQRHNRATEGQAGATLTETQRHNKQSEATAALNAGKITESQGKAGLFSSRALEADKIMQPLEEKISVTGLAVKRGLENAPVTGGVLGAAGNVMLSADQQKVEQAQRDFVNAILRQESGAAINQSEFDNAQKQYFPQPGDSKAVIEQKRKNRQTAISGLKVMAGPAAPKGGATGGWTVEVVK